MRLGRFGRDPVDLADQLAALGEAVDLATDRLPADHVEQARAIITKANDRLRHGTNHTLVALLGATGSGKSSVANALVGTNIATTGIRRPTTSSTLGCYWGGDDPHPLLDWLEVPNRHDVSGEPGAAAGAHSPASSLDGLVLLDVPDHDSVEVGHRLEMERIARHADLLVWVTDAEKYGDKAMHDYLRRLSHHGAVTAMVLNKVDLLTDDDVKTCLADLQRLMAADGLPGAPVLAVSTATGEGIPGLRSLLAETVAERSAMIERLQADVTATSLTLLDDLGPGDGLNQVPSRVTDQLAAELVGASGIAVVTDAVAAGHRRDAAGRVGWPFTRWARRLRPHPLRRLHLGRGSSGLSSLPQLSGVQLARSENAVRQALATITAELPEPWPDRISEVGTPNHALLNNQLDAVVSEAARATGAGRTPRWWAAANALQMALAVTAVVGAVWLALLAFGAYLRLPDVPTPDIVDTGIPYPTAMLVGGLLLGVVLAAVFRQLVALGSRRRATAVRSNAEAAVVQVARDLVVDPVDRELAARSRLRELLTTATGGRR
ncbi:MAG: 50S ribosome-binding GTPase [Acidimicrobiia bacterium]|nr:50S ribosome-binding GTPase [Acidimicrobiia bacterium]